MQRIFAYKQGLKFGEIDSSDIIMQKSDLVSPKENKRTRPLN